MSETGPKGPYVYQPFGPVSHPERGKTGRLFGIGGLDMQATVQGLTRVEADAIVAVLKPQAPEERPMKEDIIEIDEAGKVRATGPHSALDLQAMRPQAPEERPDLIALEKKIEVIREYFRSHGVAVINHPIVTSGRLDGFERVELPQFLDRVLSALRAQPQPR